MVTTTHVNPCTTIECSLGMDLFGGGNTIIKFVFGGIWRRFHAPIADLILDHPLPLSTIFQQSDSTPSPYSRANHWQTISDEWYKKNIKDQSALSKHNRLQKYDFYLRGWDIWFKSRTKIHQYHFYGDFNIPYPCHQCAKPITTLIPVSFFDGLLYTN